MLGTPGDTVPNVIHAAELPRTLRTLSSWVGANGSLPPPTLWWSAFLTSKGEQALRNSVSGAYAISYSEYSEDPAAITPPPIKPANAEEGRERTTQPANAQVATEAPAATTSPVKPANAEEDRVRNPQPEAAQTATEVTPGSKGSAQRKVQGSLAPKKSRRLRFGKWLKKKLNL